jgi:hypothetical protein
MGLGETHPDNVACNREFYELEGEINPRGVDAKHPRLDAVEVCLDVAGAEKALMARECPYGRG